MITEKNVVVIDRELTLEKRREFLRLPLEQRRRLLCDQAARLSAHYERDSTEREQWQGGDVCTE